MNTISMYLLTATGMVALASAPAHGQAQPSAGPSNTVTAVGCISAAVQDGSLSGSPGVPPATPATAPTLANSAQPTGAFLLNSATAPDATEADRTHAAAGQAVKEEGVTYELEGRQGDFERHAGALVEVTGVLTERSRGTAAGPKAPVKHLKVTGLKPIAAKCPTLPRN